MNWNRIQVSSPPAGGSVEPHWGGLSDADRDLIAARRAQLAGRILARSGAGRHEAEQQLAEWERIVSALWFPGRETARLSAVAPAVDVP